MPIKPENAALYPPDWPAISIAAKERAQWRCVHAGCAARQYAVGRWTRFGSRWDWIEMREPAPNFAQARQEAADLQWGLFGDEPGTDKIIVIVLTVAHLDHDPTNCAPANLAPMCQRHHLAYDQQHHNESAYMTRMAKRGNQELPL